MSATQIISDQVKAGNVRRSSRSPSPLRAASVACELSHDRQAELTSVAWVAHDELSCDEWLRHGRRLGVAGRNAAWWIGDWVRYGATRYGRKYELATRVTRYEHQTLLNMVYVATRFEISRRRENLSWSHHAELAPLDVDEQERWLDRATEERLSIRCLRNELAAARQAADALSEIQRPKSMPAPHANPRQVRRGDGEVVEATAVTCPRCGHRFRGDAGT